MTPCVPILARLCAGALALLCSGQVRAEMDADGFMRALREHPSSAMGYLMGIGTGLSWANLEARSRTGRGLYCVPDNDPVTPELHLKVLRDHLASYPQDGAAPVGAAALKSLTHRFPCYR